MFTAEACTPCVVHRINNDEMLNLLQSNIKASYNMCLYLFDQLEIQAREAVNASVYSVLQRLSALLLALVDEQGEVASPVVLPMTNQELASILGAHRNSVNNALSSLRKSGCIEKVGNGLAIVSPEKLLEIAKGVRSLVGDIC